MFRLCCNFDNKSYVLFDEWSYQMHNSCWNHQQAPWALNVVQNVCHFPDFLFFTALIFDLPDQILKLLKARERLIFWTIYDLIYSYSIISTTDNNNNILFFNETKKNYYFIIIITIESWVFMLHVFLVSIKIIHLTLKRKSDCIILLINAPIYFILKHLFLFRGTLYILQGEIHIFHWHSVLWYLKSR